MAAAASERRFVASRRHWVCIGGAVVLAFLCGTLVTAGWNRTSNQSGPQQPSAADIAYAQSMAGHHEQAIVLCDSFATDPDTDPEVRHLISQIRATQLREIGELRGWLRLWGAPQLPESDLVASHEMAGMHTSHADGMQQMHGMASIQEIQQLQQSRGRQAETSFIQLMLRHHQGGVTMAQTEMIETSIDPIRAATQSLIIDQVNEINVLSTHLTKLGASPLPTN